MGKVEAVEAVRPDSLEAYIRTLEHRKAWKEVRSRKRARVRGRSKAEIELVNIFKDLGIDYLKLDSMSEAFNQVPKRWEGKRVDSLSQRALEFIQANWEFEKVQDDEHRLLIHFKKRGENEVPSIYDEMAEILEPLGQTKKTCQAVVEALIRVGKRHLRHDRKFVIPQFIRLVVRYQPAKEEHEGRNPFTGKKIMVAAKDATNRLKVFPAKQMKDYVAEKVEVEEPPKKKSSKKKGDEKKDSKKKHKSKK